MAVRQIRWEYTFYSDRRFVTHLEVNNSGGADIAAVRIRWPQPAAVSGVGLRQEVELAHLPEVCRWNFLTAVPDPNRHLAQESYLHPGKIVCTLGDAKAMAPGDVDRDGFDESQGCYFLRAQNGHCRFRLLPPPEGLLDAAFRVEGKWRATPTVSCEGLAIRNAVRLADGSMLFVLHGLTHRPTAIEVEGPAEE